MANDRCKHCGGLIALANPTGNCVHMYWPDCLTDEAKRANGYQKVLREVWIKPVTQNGEHDGTE